MKRRNEDLLLWVGLLIFVGFALFMMIGTEWLLNGVGR